MSVSRIEPRSTGPKPSSITTWPPRLVWFELRFDSYYPPWFLPVIPCVFCPSHNEARFESWLFLSFSLSWPFALMFCTLWIFPWSSYKTGDSPCIRITWIYDSYIIKHVCPHCLASLVSSIKGLGCCQLTVSPTPLLTQVSNSSLSIKYSVPLRCNTQHSVFPFSCSHANKGLAWNLVFSLDNDMTTSFAFEF